MTQILDQSDLTDRAAQLVEAAKAAGGDAADAVCVRGVSLSVDVRLGKVEETNRAEGDDFSLRVFVGRRSASVSANVLTDPKELAERAVAMASVAPEDAFTGLADEALLVRDPRTDLELLDETIPGATLLTEQALAAEDAMRAVEGVTRSGGASAGWSLGGMVLATSTGFAGSYLASRFSLSASAIAGSDTAMERDYEGDYKVHHDDMDDPREIGRKAAERAVRRLGATQYPTGPVTVVFDPRVATGLLGSLASATNASAIARKTSFLRDKLGQSILPKTVTVTDEPLRKRALGTRPFDGEGVEPLGFDLVRDGVLQTWFLDSATGRELGLETNGHARRGGGNPSPGPTNLTLMPGEKTPEELMAEIGEGIYVTEMIGHGANLVTGDYSRGAAGFAIRDGQLAEPVSEITVAGNLNDMFQRLTPASDLRYRFSMNAPTIAVEGLTVAGR